MDLYQKVEEYFVSRAEEAPDQGSPEYFRAAFNVALEAGISIDELAIKVDVARPTIERWRDGKTYPQGLFRPSILEQLAIHPRLSRME
ncbi:MAG: helix-turn-helix transcriptional regulator [archaeon]|nr:helix-turn-helix transcriptional regulator [archaeon]